MTELWQLPASALRGKIAAKEVSPVELTKAVLARADKLQPALNCFITLVPELALKAAQAAEEAFSNHHELVSQAKERLSVARMTVSQAKATQERLIGFGNGILKLEEVVMLPDVQVGRNARLNRVVIDHGVRIPEGLVVGEDPELDAKRFRVSEKGICLITQDMINKLSI